MDAQHLLLTAVALQRDGRKHDEIEVALIDIARREAPGCHFVRDFNGHVEIMFPDGQSLRCDGWAWSVHQQGHVAPLYDEATAAIGPAGGQQRGHAS